MARTIVFFLSAREAETLADWDYENPEPNGEGWYFETIQDGVTLSGPTGPYSTRQIATYAATGRF